MVAFAIFDSRHETLSLEERASAPVVQDGKGVAVAAVGRRDRFVTFRSPGSHPRGRDEEGGSDKRTSVAEQQDKEPDPDLGRRHASALLPLTSAARSRPPQEGPSDFSRDTETLSFPLSLFLFHAASSSLSLSLSTTTRAPFW